MKKILRAADRIMYGFVNYVSAAMTFLIFAIVTLVVVCRFVFKSSSMGFEELPTYFMMIAIWLGAVICSRDPKEGQIKIDLIVNAVKSARARAAINIVCSLFSISCIGLYTYLSWEYTRYVYSVGQATFALKVPIWILVGLSFVACLFLTIYEIAILVREARGFGSVGRESEGAA